MQELNFQVLQKIQEGDRLLREHKPSQAVTIIKEAAKAVPDHPYSQYLLGIARMKCDRFFLAEEAVKRANELEPDNDELVRSLGWITVMLGDLQEGRKLLRRSIDLNLTKVESYLDLAMSYAHYFEFEEARKWFQTARSLAPDDPYGVECGKIMDAMERDFAKYSPKKLQKMRQEKLDPKIQKEFRLSVLEDFLRRNQTLTTDEVEEITEEFRRNGFPGRIAIIPAGADLKDTAFDCDLCKESHSGFHGRDLDHEQDLEQKIEMVPPVDVLRREWKKIQRQGKKVKEPGLFLNRLSKLTNERFLNEFFRWGFSGQDFSRIEQETSKRKDFIGGIDDYDSSDMFLRYAQKILTSKKLRHPAELNSFAREFQALMNHWVYQFDGVMPISRFLVEVLIRREELGRKKPKDFCQFIELCFRAHKAIDFFLRKEEEANRKYWNAFQRRMEKFDERRRKEGKAVNPVRTDYYDKYWKIDPRVYSVAHYILDWYLMIEPHLAYRKSPARLAAIAIYLTEKINAYAGGQGIACLSAERLARFGGWAGKGSIYSSTDSAFYSVIYNARDLELLLVDPVKAPKNWYKKLQEIAPALETERAD